MNKRITLIIITVILLMVSLAGCTSPELERHITREEHAELVATQKVYKAKVRAITSDRSKADDSYEGAPEIRTIKFLTEITDGKYKGVLMNARQTLDPTDGYRLNPVKVGDQVFLQPYYDDHDRPIGEMADYMRSSPLIYMALVFAIALLVFSRTKGLRSLVALIITCLAVFYIFVPMVIGGTNPMLAAALVCTIITISTLVIVYGFKIKTLSAGIGCLIGILVAAGVAALFGLFLHITGILDQETIMLVFNCELDMKGLLFAAIIIGALGATMDVAISIASSLEEIIAKVETPLSRGEIIRSGMKIGGDIMGTMTNTLILAYVGSALPAILLLAISEKQPEYAISWEKISTEILRALAGSIGLICVVPATALVTALLHGRGRKKIKATKVQNSQTDEDDAIELETEPDA